MIQRRYQPQCLCKKKKKIKKGPVPEFNSNSENLKIRIIIIIIIIITKKKINKIKTNPDIFGTSRCLWKFPDNSGHSVFFQPFLHLQVEDKVKDFIKKHINTTYEGRIDTSEEFSLGLDFAQVYVSIFCRFRTNILINPKVSMQLPRKGNSSGGGWG